MRHLVPITISILFSGHIFAEGNVTHLKKQVVSADQVSLPELIAEEFDHPEFAGKYQNLSEFLQYNAGIQTRSSGIGNLVTLSIRGSSHQQIQFIVDGHEINDAQYGGFDINRLPLQQIERIKIIKNNSDGIGGTIIIDTINSNAVNGSKAFISAGSFDTNEYGITQSISGLGQATISLNRLVSKANYEYPVPSPFLEPSHSGKVEELRNNQYDKNSALFKWQHKTTPNANLGIKLQAINSKKNLPNYQQNRYDNNAYLSDAELDIQGFHEYRLNHSLINSVRINHNSTDETYSDPGAFIGVGSFINKYDSETIKLTEALSYKSQNRAISLAYNFKSEKFQDDHTLVSDSVKCLNTTSTCDIKSTQVSNKWKLSNDWTSKDQNHELSFNVSQINLTKRQESLFSAPEQTKVKNSYISWGSSYSYFAFKDSSIRIGLSKSLRTPTLYELFGNRGLMKSNINLKPEESYNLNFNINSAYNLVTLETDLYYRNLSDAIVAQFSGGTGSFKNLSSADILGIESKITGYFNRFKISLIAIIQDSLVKSEINGFDNKKLAGIFHRSISSNVNFALSQHIDLIYQFQSDQGLYVDTANLDKHSGRVIHNIRLNYALDKISASLTIENLLDNRYHDQNNRPAPGLILNSNIQYRF